MRRLWWERFVIVVLFGVLVWFIVHDTRRVDKAWLYHQMHVTVYFSDADAAYLVPEQRMLLADEEPVEATLRELIRGPMGSELYPTIPAGVLVREWRQDGRTLFVSFSEHLRTEHGGGSAGEILTVYSIVNSLTELPGVETVVILLEGRYEETLVGHLILDEPFARDESLISPSASLSSV